MRSPVRAVLAAVGAMGFISCAEPTAVVIAVFSEVPCSANAAVAFSVADEAVQLQGAAVRATATQCEDVGDQTVRRGTVTVVPSGDPEKRLAFQLVTRTDDKAPSECATRGENCIVARRQLRFRQHDTIDVRVDMRVSCVGVVCAADQTCVKGACVSSSLQTCDTCGESDLVPDEGVKDAGPPDAGPPDTGAPDAGPPVSVDLNGGTTWSGWTKLGNAQDPGIYAAQARTTDFDVYYTSFLLPPNAVATAADRGNALADLSVGSFATGDLIVGVGIVWKNGQAGNNPKPSFIRFDRNATGSFAASTSVAPAAGNGQTSEDSNGGTGVVQFDTVPYRFGALGCVFGWSMRSPSAPTGALITPTTTGGVPTGQFLNVSRDFWGQTFGSTTAEVERFKRALPFRTYGKANPDGTISSYQWLIDSSAFDRAGSQYSSLAQSFTAKWSFALIVSSKTSDWTEVVGTKLPLIGH